MMHASRRASKTWLEKSYIVSAAQGDRRRALKVNLRAVNCTRGNGIFGSQRLPATGALALFMVR
jgi:hypothetical protein